MQSPATFMISVITFKSPIFKKNTSQFHITLKVHCLVSALSYFHLSNVMWVQSEKTARCTLKNTKLFSSLLKNIRHSHTSCRTITTRVMAKFAPGCVAHPAAAWVPQLVRKYLTAVQRDMQEISLQTTEMTSARQIPSSSCSFAQYELSVLTGILCYSREKSRDLHSSPHGEGSCWGLPCAGIPFLSYLPFPIWLFYMRLFLMIFFFLKLLFQRLSSEAAKLSYQPPPLLVIFGVQPLCF